MITATARTGTPASKNRQDGAEKSNRSNEIADRTSTHCLAAPRSVLLGEDVSVSQGQSLSLLSFNVLSVTLVRYRF
jgi:hypothetical protein